MNAKLIQENNRRMAALTADYDPVTGRGAVGARTLVDGVYIPDSMLEEMANYKNLEPLEQEKLRIRHDFEYWCYRCIKITDKMTGQLVPFILNQPQRKLLAAMEEQRLANKPVRIILLKARQWGGSTLVQVYIAWHQLVLFKGKNSVIVGHKRNSSYAIKQMFRTIINNYPQEFLDGAELLSLVNAKESSDIQELTTRDCSITLSSSFSPDAARGQNLSLAHLSEVSFWKSSRNIDPTDLIRSITGTITLSPGTVIVLESTANGMNSFFYKEWMRAKRGKSAFKPVFVGWQEIALYTLPLDENFDFDNCDDYEKALWDNGCCLEQINWYHEKRKEYSEHNLLKAEFPSDDIEAFVSSVNYVFSQQEQEQIVENIQQPFKISEEVSYWIDPCKAWINSQASKYEFLAMLTIGSETDSEKPSVISVWKLNIGKDNKPQCPELACQWSGNLPLNILAGKSIKIAKSYQNALLAIENNDIAASHIDRQQGEFILNEAFRVYNNLYYFGKKKYLLEINRDNFSLMFYELIINARNSLYFDHSAIASQAVSKLTIHANNRFYSDDPAVFQYVVNRAELLYIVRDITLKASKPYSHEDIKELTSVEVPLRFKRIFQ